MVSGFLTSPCDHSRIFSGDAREIRIALKESGSLGFSKKLKMSRIGSSFSLLPTHERNSETRVTRRGFTRRREDPKVEPSLLLLLVLHLLFRGVVDVLSGRLDELDVQTQGLEF